MTTVSILNEGFKKKYLKESQESKKSRVRKSSCLRESFVSGLARVDLIDLIDMFYGKSYAHEGPISEGRTIDEILDQYGADPDDSRYSAEGFYNTMSDDELMQVFAIIRQALRLRAEYYSTQPGGRELLHNYGIVQRWVYEEW